MLSFMAPNHKHVMCGFLSEGCCIHLVHIGDRGWVNTGPIYELILLYQFLIVFLFTGMFVFVSLGFIYGAYFSVHTRWPI